MGAREDHKSEVMYPNIPLLQDFRGTPVVPKDTLGVHGAKKVKKPCPRVSRIN